MRLVTSSEMASIDRRAQEDYGIPGTILMESAGAAAWDRLRRYFLDDRPATLAFVAGTGNNGGDALVMARYCALDSPHRALVILARATMKGEGALQERIVRSLGLPVAVWEDEPKQARLFLAQSDWIVDGLAGTGLSGPLRAPMVEIAAAINESGKRVAAVDAPSGVGDGDAPTGGVRADVTLTMGLPKRALYEPANRGLCGDIYVVPVSFPRQLVEDPSLTGELGAAPDLAGLIPPLESTAHKGDRGVVAVFAGSPGTTGAAALAANGALSARAGLVTLFADAGIYPVVAVQLVSVMTRALEAAKGGPAGNAELPELGKFGSAVVGPGWGTAEGRGRLLAAIAGAVPNGVLDADGITVLSRMTARPDLTGWVLTPHPGELAALLGVTTSDVMRSLYDAAFAAAVQTGAVVAAKAATTFVVRPDGRLWVVDGANPLLATAGSGDVLSGVIGALLAGGASPWDAARAGVLLHAEAGRDLAARRGVFHSSELPAAVGERLGRVMAGS